MDVLKKKKQLEKKNIKNPQTKIKELQKDIETLETEVQLLLEHVPAGSIDSVCVVCQQTITEYYDLSCQHVICQTCYQRDRKRSIHCPLCVEQKDLFHAQSIDSSSSSEDNEII